MDLTLSDEQQALQEMISGFASDRFDIDTVVRAFGEPGGFDRGAWAELAALGTFGIAVPEEQGGVGLGAIDAVLVHEALAAGLVPVPLVAATLAAGLVDGTVFGLVFGIGTGLTFCLVGVLETPLDLSTAVNPRGLLHTNRRTVATQLLVWSVAFGVVGLLVGCAPAAPLPYGIDPFEGIGRIRWRVALVRQRGGAPHHWLLEAPDAEARLALAARSGDRPDQARRAPVTRRAVQIVAA